jgi:hypothetical protein
VSNTFLSIAFCLLARGDDLPAAGWPVDGPKEANQESSYLVLNGRFCTVKTTAPQKAGLAIARFIDAHIGNFRQVFVGPFKVTGKPVVRVFAHDAEFLQRYQKVYRLIEASLNTPRSALYSPSEKETWITLQGPADRKTMSVETVKHELTHHLLRFYLGTGSPSPWFEEGVACFFQYWNVAEAKKQNLEENVARSRMGDFGYFIDELKRAFKGPSFVSPRQLFRLNYQEFHDPDPKKERLYYSESWALVNFLFNHEKGRKFVDSIVQSLRSGKKSAALLPERELEALTTLWYQDLESRLLR